MLKISKTLGVLLLSLSLISFSGCGSKQKKIDAEDTGNVNTEALAQFQKEKQDLLQTANARLAELNRKILQLNDKINKGGTKLTDEQNNAIDTFEKKRASINQRIHQIKNVTYDDWNTFKTRFESDLQDCCADIDKLLTEL